MIVGYFKRYKIIKYIIVILLLIHIVQECTKRVRQSSFSREKEFLDFLFDHHALKYNIRLVGWYGACPSRREHIHLPTPNGKDQSHEPHQSAQQHHERKLRTFWNRVKENSFRSQTGSYYPSFLDVYLVRLVDGALKCPFSLHYVRALLDTFCKWRSVVNCSAPCSGTEKEPRCRIWVYTLHIPLIIVLHKQADVSWIYKLW